MDGDDQSPVWITGAGGLIGNYLVQLAPQFAPRWPVRALTREQLDLLDFDAVHRAFRKQQPKLVIHCAAMSRSPDCQARPELARRVNVDTTTLLAELAAEMCGPLFAKTTGAQVPVDGGNERVI